MKEFHRNESHRAAPDQTSTCSKTLSEPPWNSCWNQSDCHCLVSHNLIQLVILRNINIIIYKYGKEIYIIIN